MTVKQVRMLPFCVIQINICILAHSADAESPSVQKMAIARSLNTHRSCFGNVYWRKCETALADLPDFVKNVLFDIVYPPRRFWAAEQRPYNETLRFNLGSQAILAHMRCVVK